MILNTFSIIAHCPETGMLGGAVTTGRPFVGTLVPHCKINTGIAASQALANPYLSFKTFEELANGSSVKTATQKVLNEDPGKEKRQFSILDNCGNEFAFTGSENISWAGHYIGDGYIVAGNMLSGEEVIQKMSVAFEKAADEELGERLLRALESVNKSNTGDVRGKRSSALYVMHGEVYGYIDIRVDDHNNPIERLRYLFEIWKKTQRPYQQLMPTKENLAGEIDDKVISQIREKLVDY